jgi:signal transduction histidine kinase
MGGLMSPGTQPVSAEPARHLMSPGTDSVPGPPADEPQPTPEPRWPPPFTVTILPYMMLFFCVFLTLIFQQATPVTMAINVGLSALAGAWIVAWHNRPRMTLVFMTGLILIMMVLVFRASWYGFFTLTAYFYSIKLLPWPSRLIGVGFVGFMAAVSQSYYLVKTDSTGALVFLVVVLVNVGGSCLFTYYNWNSTVQAERRQQAVDELSEANRKLEAALAENAGLHAQLLTQAREAGVLDERHRIAREIHDTLAQGLSAGRPCTRSPSRSRRRASRCRWPSRPSSSCCGRPRKRSPMWPSTRARGEWA